MSEGRRQPEDRAEGELPTRAAAEMMAEPNGGVSRRRLFYGAAAGALAASALTSTAGPAHADPGSRAEASEPAYPSTLPLLDGSEFPIGLFWPPPPYQSTAQRFAEIARAGFTFLVSGNYAADGNILGYQLARAKEAGLQMLVSDDVMVRNMSRWFTITDTGGEDLAITEAEAATLFNRARDAYQPTGALAGFNLFDEPSPPTFASLSRAVSVARREAPTLLPYVNLLPSNDRSYYTSFVDQVRPDVLSYDRYPLLADGTDDPGYILNAAIAREVSLAAKIPWWIFIQSLGYTNHRTPSAAEMLWQINQSLAYGAQGIQYFTYWTPDPARGEAFEPALITVDGRRTARWDHARTINTGWLQPVGRQLKGLVSTSVSHAGEAPLPEGATGFQPDALLTRVTGGPVIVSQFASSETSSTDRWLFVANREHRTAITARITLSTKIKQVARFDAGRNRYVSEPGSTITARLPRGAAVLYRLR